MPYIHALFHARSRLPLGRAQQRCDLAGDLQGQGDERRQVLDARGRQWLERSTGAHNNLAWTGLAEQFSDATPGVVARNALLHIRGSPKHANSVVRLSKVE